MQGIEFYLFQGYIKQKKPESKDPGFFLNQLIRTG
jgi:hypothetical protein